MGPRSVDHGKAASAARDSSGPPSFNGAAISRSRKAYLQILLCFQRPARPFASAARTDRNPNHPNPAVHP